MSPYSKPNYPKTKEENDAIRREEERLERERLKALRDADNQFRREDRKHELSFPKNNLVSSYIKTPRHLIGDDADKYRELKKRMRDGEMIPREDFIFVKVADQKENATIRWSRIKTQSQVQMGMKRTGGHFNA